MVINFGGNQAKRGGILPHEEPVFRLRGIERADCDSGREIPQRLASSYVWIAAVAGEGTVVCEQGRTPLEAGGMLLFAPGRTFGIETGSAESFSAYLLLFDVFREEEANPGRLRALTGETGFRFGPSEIYVPAARLLAVCESIGRYWQSPEVGERMKARAGFLELIGEWSAASAGPRRDPEKLLQRTKTFIDEHYREPLKLDELADMAGLSRNYYVGQFKKRYGKSVVEYMTDLRIRRAKRLMAGGSDLKLREVAQQVGYSDEFYFSRRFKQETGIAPSAYVKSRARRIAAYGPIATGYLLALGIIPYAAPLHPKWNAYYHRRYADDIPVHLSGYKLGEHREANLSRLAQSRPERIVCGGVSDEEKRRLEEIAEVVYIRPETDWRAALRETAAVLEAEQEAERWLASYDEAAATIGSAIGRRRSGERTLMIRFIDGRFYSAASSSAAGVLRFDLGIPVFEWPDEYEARVPLGLDLLAASRADRILLLVCQEDATLAAWERLRQSPEWTGLPAVASGKLHLIASDPWRESTPSAHKRVLKEASRIF
ncbi:AraC family transcriptional regulator [Saccharibacillus sp. O23]|uniref:AraC family transcriptional regulator n=1 Tax=Saccharibacillus sp. O23 TaxID=2009338 RepID=UPI000B4E3D05|nr:AraC family transcriptional regulator [Saccharibacillus sp. O23]OWR31520.1 AraC family transcriptional regulator [Saccharibacillus sp. O23]